MSIQFDAEKRVHDWQERSWYDPREIGWNALTILFTFLWVPLLIWPRLEERLGRGCCGHGRHEKGKCRQRKPSVGIWSGERHCTCGWTKEEKRVMEDSANREEREWRKSNAHIDPKLWMGR